MPLGACAQIEFEEVDDSWLVVPLAEPQVVLTTADGVVARCDGGMGSCAVPPLPARSDGRRLAEEQSTPAAAHEDGSKEGESKEAYLEDSSASNGPWSGGRI